MRPLFPVLLVAFAAASASAQSDNMSLVGQLDPRPGDSYSDVWTHVGPDGREYALLASWISGGLNVIDVTEDQPVLEEFVPMNGDGADIEAYGHYAYLTSNFSPTLIIDLSDPTDPTPVRTFGGDFHTLSIADGYLYGNGSGGVMIYSLADPANPAFVGQYNPYYVHDVLVRGDTMYTAGIYGDGIDIVDLSDRANPTLIERFNYPGSGAHNFCSDPSGSYLYVGDEIGTGRWTRIFDVRDPHDVEQVGEIIVDAGSTVHNCHTKDGLLYLAHYGRGAWVFDITDPVNPEQVAYYDEPGMGSIWTVNPQLPSGKIVASDMSNGLVVLRIDDPPGPSLTAEIDPVSPPVVLPPSGGPFSYTARVTNNDAAPHAFEAWVTATLPNGSPYGPVVGPVSVTLQAGGSVQRTLRLRVPAAAPAGTYTLTLNVGDYPSGVEASDSFTFMKQAAQAAPAAGVAAREDVGSGGGEAGLTSEGAFFDEGTGSPLAASVTASGGRIAVYPNPTEGRSTVGFTLDGGAAVRLSVLDALGREVAVLAEGSLASGDHTYAFEGRDLPVGFYLARLEVDGRVETRRFTIVR